MARLRCPECDAVVKIPADYDRPSIRCPDCEIRIPVGIDEDAIMPAKRSKPRPTRRAESGPFMTADQIWALVIVAIGVLCLLAGIFVRGALQGALFVCAVAPIVGYIMGLVRASQAGHSISIDYLDSLGGIRFVIILLFLGLYILGYLALWFIAQVKTAGDRPRVALPWVLMPVYSFFLFFATIFVAFWHVPRLPRDAHGNVIARQEELPPVPKIARPALIVAPKAEAPKVEVPILAAPKVAEKPPEPKNAPAPNVVGIDEEKSTIRYLSDMQETIVRDGPWPFGKNGRTGLKGEVPIKVAGVASPHGLGMHPPRGIPGVTSYRLERTATTFKTGVAINDGGSGIFGAIYFEVLGDGRTLWLASFKETGKVEECAVDVTDVDVLELRVSCKNLFEHLHGVWLEPRVVLLKK
jgi:hypothetical protein